MVTIESPQIKEVIIDGNVEVHDKIVIKTPSQTPEGRVEKYIKKELRL